MSRRHRAEKRVINPDPKFGDLVLSKFMNSIMLDGKKSVAERIVYAALDQVEEKSADSSDEHNFSIYLLWILYSVNSLYKEPDGKGYQKGNRNNGSENLSSVPSEGERVRGFSLGKIESHY